MADNFQASLKMVLKHEGGFVDHPKDPGGATNKGVTRQTYESFLGRPLESVNELIEIPDEHIQEIYRIRYWDKVKGDDLPSGLDFSVFDWGVNSGPSRSAKFLQGLVGVTQDGAIGPRSLEAISQHDPKDLIVEMAAKREGFYRSLSTFDTFGKGWLRRNEETRDFALELV